MAKPYSSGLPYCALDVGFFYDDRVCAFIGRHGEKGLVPYFRILCDAVGKCGYYRMWDETARAVFAGRNGYNYQPEGKKGKNGLWEWTLGYLEYGLFDERVFREFQVLTSAELQRNYLRAKHGSDKIPIEEGLLLLDLDDPEDVSLGVRGKIYLQKHFSGENPSFSGENPSFSGENPTKESEEKEGNEKEREYEPAPRFIPPTLDDIRDYCAERRNGIDARRFINYYESNGWKVGKNPMKDWKAAIRGWERNGVSNVKNADAPPPSYDLDAIMRSAVDFDPAKTKRGEV